jgi:hypothetical protein
MVKIVKTVLIVAKAAQQQVRTFHARVIHTKMFHYAEHLCHVIYLGAACLHGEGLYSAAAGVLALIIVVAVLGGATIDAE